VRPRPAVADAQAEWLMTQPGVGSLTAPATVLVLGPVTRFLTSKHVVSYIGLAPLVNASAEKHRLGHVTKQATPCSATCWVKGARSRRVPIPVSALPVPCSALRRWLREESALPSATLE
jgi:transposase